MISSSNEYPFPQIGGTHPGRSSHTLGVNHFLVVLPTESVASNPVLRFVPAGAGPTRVNAVLNFFPAGAGPTRVNAVLKFFPAAVSGFVTSLVEAAFPGGLSDL